MKRTLAAVLIVLAAFGVASAQAGRSAADKGVKAIAPDDAVELLLARNLLAQGGVATFGIKTRITRGRVQMSESPNPGTFESYEKAPDKKMEVLNAPTGQFIDAADGTRRWEKSPWGLAVTLGGADDSRDGGAPGARAYRWRKYFSSAKIRGRAVLDGREVVVLDATPRGDRPVVMYFDAETWLLSRQDFSPPATRQENEFKSVVIDRYDVVDGVKIPTVFRQVFTKYTLTFRIYEVKHNVPIDDALFRDPNGK
ncbi:MAG TPA: hypothetical protein VM936_20720 [Pyrinomonadaceae bacterium]|nr:hypothetical protein [Pyrinomonadaceae bacterium]